MRLLLFIFLIFVIFSPPARAYDYATESTQILNNIELLTENIHQLQSLYNEVEMIKNQVEGLKSVANYQNNFTDVDAIRNHLESITSQGSALSNQTQGLLTDIQQEVNNLPANGTMSDRESYIDQNTMNILQNALNRVTQERQTYPQEANALNALIAKNNQAQGQTQALQTSNEMAAQTIAQMQSTRELLSENIIVQATAAMREIQERKDMINTMGQMVQSADNSESSINAEN